MYAVTVLLEGHGDRAVLLSLASLLHRRAVHPRRAELSAETDGRRTVTTTLARSPRQAATFEASLGDLIHVRGIALGEMTGDESTI